MSAPLEYVWVNYLREAEYCRWRPADHAHPLVHVLHEWSRLNSIDDGAFLRWLRARVRGAIKPWGDVVARVIDLETP